MDLSVVCKAVVVFALTRWLLSLALNLLTKFSNPSTSCCSSSSSSCSPSSSDNIRRMSKNVGLTTLENIQHRLCDNEDISCAICLNRLRKKSQVYDLTNCSHVFHKHCLEKWLLYDKQMTCPLCRASLVPPTVEPPSWPVDQMLYLFGDDLLPSYTSTF